MRVVTGNRSGEGEGQQKAEQREDRAFDGVAFKSAILPATDAPAKLNKQEHGGEEQKGEKRWKDHWLQMTIANWRIYE